MLNASNSFKKTDEVIKKYQFQDMLVDEIDSVGGGCFKINAGFCVCNKTLEKIVDAVIRIGTEIIIDKTTKKE